MFSKLQIKGRDTQRSRWWPTRGIPQPKRS